MPVSRQLFFNMVSKFLEEAGLLLNVVLWSFENIFKLHLQHVFADFRFTRLKVSRLKTTMKIAKPQSY